MTDRQPPSPGPTFYSRPAFLSHPRLRDWWTLLHPPYTVFFLSLVAIGATLEGPVQFPHLGYTLLAFFLALGVSAHAMDELHGRPLRTSIPTNQLVVASVLGLLGAVALGITGAIEVSGYLAIFIVVGVIVAIGYNLELFQGRLHTDLVFEVSWGAFPVLTAYFTQHATIHIDALLASFAAGLLAKAQRHLSTRARALRRSIARIDGLEIHHDGSRIELSVSTQLAPLEHALRSLCGAVFFLACALVAARGHFI